MTPCYVDLNTHLVYREKPSPGLHPNCLMINESLYKPFKLECSVPRGSCLGPLLFTLNTSELFEIIKHHLPMLHCYADDSQVYISFSPNDRAEKLAVVRNMEDCIRDIRSWMFNNDLKFHDDKTLVHHNSLES